MSLKVTGTDTDRSYYWSIVLVIVTVSMSRTVSKLNGDFGRNRKFSPCILYNAIAEGFPVGIFSGGGAQETGSCPHQTPERVWRHMRSLRCNTRVDRQTGFGICHNSIVLCMYYMLARDKNDGSLVLQEQFGAVQRINENSKHYRTILTT